MNNACKRTFILIVILTYFMSTREVDGSHEVDDIERNLSNKIADDVEIKLRNPLSLSDEGYGYFLLAVYKHDPLARIKAEKIYQELASPESQAFLGSIEMLKARDLASGSILGAFVDLFTKKRYVQNGIKNLDTLATVYPSNLEIRIVRAITYLELPSFFLKFNTGLKDIETIIQWIEERKATVPNEEMFFRDRSSVYYYAGRYFLKAHRISKARDMFLRSSMSSDQSPFAEASRKRLANLTLSK